MSIRLKPNEKSVFIGINDQGKSVLFYHLVKTYLEAGVQVLLYDSELEYGAWEHPNLKIHTPSSPGNREEFDDVCGMVWERRRMILAVESIDFYAETMKPLTPFFKKIIHWGRNRGIGLMVTARRPAGVHKDIGTCQHWFLFHTYIPNDIKWIKEFVGKTAEDLITMRQYYFIHWTSSGAELCNPLPQEVADEYMDLKRRSQAMHMQPKEAEG